MAKNKIAEQEVVEAQAVAQDFTFDQLNPGGAAQTADVVPISRSGLNYKITISAIAAFVNANLNAVQSIAVDSSILKSGTATNPSLAVNKGTDEGQTPVLGDAIKNLAALSNLIYGGQLAMTDPQAPHNAKPIDQVAAELLALIQAAGGVTGISNGTDTATGLVQLLAGSNVNITKHPTIANAFVIAATGGGGSGGVTTLNGIAGALKILPGLNVTVDTDPVTGEITIGVQNVNNTATYVDVVLDGFTAGGPDCFYDNGNDGVGATLTSKTLGVIGQIDGQTVNVGSSVFLYRYNGGITPPATNQLAYQGKWVLINNGSVSSPWIMTRASDFCTIDTMLEGTTFTVLKGDNYGGCQVVFNGFDQFPPVMGTSGILLNISSPLLDDDTFNELPKIPAKFLPPGSATTNNLNYDGTTFTSTVNTIDAEETVDGSTINATDPTSGQQAKLNLILQKLGLEYTAPGAAVYTSVSADYVLDVPIPAFNIVETSVSGVSVYIPALNSSPTPLSKGQFFIVVNSSLENNFVLKTSDENIVQVFNPLDCYIIYIQDNTSVGNVMPIPLGLGLLSPTLGLLTGILRLTVDDISDPASALNHFLTYINLDNIYHNPPEGGVIYKGNQDYLAVTGSAGQFLQSNGPNAAPSFVDDPNQPFEFSWIPVDMSGVSLVLSLGRGFKNGNKINLNFVVSYPSTSGSAYAQLGGWPSYANPGDINETGYCCTTSAVTAPNGLPFQMTLLADRFTLRCAGVVNLVSDVSGQYIQGHIEYYLDAAASAAFNEAFKNGEIPAFNLDEWNKGNEEFTTMSEKLKADKLDEIKEMLNSDSMSSFSESKEKSFLTRTEYNNLKNRIVNLGADEVRLELFPETEK